ncbi:hypothetical protein KRR38_06120 [Novosphingobium sp. G106]|uniref:hypothetical protein n=1 Tax=Novosphingobium sp. G106 TaxID=2849500 RepID=UPI001C2DADC5|nr:hypothetical protein [Novosphingobium sp. G106]MBV1687260.1 hypothetical protein [Novosphingobium sp. G106]
MPLFKALFAAALALPFTLGIAQVAEAAGGPDKASTAQVAAPAATIDTNADGKADAWDRDGNGSADAWDTNGDGKPDKYDTNGDGKPDSDSPAPR